MHDSSAEEGLSEDAIPNVLHRKIEVSLDVAHARPRAITKEANEVQGALGHLGIHHVMSCRLW